jgi:hypothetical protein
MCRALRKIQNLDGKIVDQILKLFSLHDTFTEAFDFWYKETTYTHSDEDGHYLRQSFEAVSCLIVIGGGE